MARPKQHNPTPAELEILKVLWRRDGCTVRQVLEALARKPAPAYTSVMSLLNVMTDKGLTTREPRGRAFAYSATRPRERTLGELVGDLLSRAFEGSASDMVAHILDEREVGQAELDAIRRAIDEYGHREDAP